jgi:hypothetical protein
MSATDDLKAALDPLLTRAQRRAERIKQLRAQPPTEQTAKAIAAEQREIDLAVKVATSTSALVERLSAAPPPRPSFNPMDRAFADVYRQMEDQDLLFDSAMQVIYAAGYQHTPVSLPALLGSTERMLARMKHIRTSPSTFAATYPSPFPKPTDDQPTRQLRA